MASLKKEVIMDVGVTVGTPKQILDEIFARIERQEKTSIIAINPEKIITAERDEEVKTILNESEIAIADGIGVLLASKLQRGEIRSRVTGVDMMEMICANSGCYGKSVFLYGAQKGVAEVAARRLQEKYKDLQVAGTIDGYTPEEEVVEAIEKSGAEIVFVALGSPKQEQFIRRHRDALSNAYVFQGVGGSFDVFSGRVQRAPKLFQKTGTEWLYRLMKEPSRLRRQMKIPKFLIKILKSSKK